MNRRWKARARCSLVAALVACGDVGNPNSPVDPASTVAQITDATQMALSGVVGAETSEPVAVRLTNADGDGVANVSVNFRVTAGEGSLAAAALGSSLRSGAAPTTDIDVRTNEDGVARAFWMLGTAAGEQLVVANVAVGAVTFRVVAEAGGPDQFGPADNSLFIGMADSVGDDPIAVEVHDRFGNPVPGQSVSWVALTTGAAVGVSASTTDADGRAETPVALGPAQGANQFQATVGILGSKTLEVIGVVGAGDPVGDGGPPADTAFQSHDITFFGTAVADGTLWLYMRLAEPAAIRYPSGEQPPSAMLARWMLDTDQDRATGAMSPAPCAPNGDTLVTGTDLLVEVDHASPLRGLFPEAPASAVFLLLVDSTVAGTSCLSHQAGWVVPEVRGRAVIVGIDTGFWEVDGAFDFSSLAGSPGAWTDRFPDAGALTFPGPAPASAPLTSTAVWLPASASPTPA